jgi:membrane associated rhomboid family serine protease
MGELRRSRRREQADDWALALASQHLRPTVQGDAGGFCLSVPDEEVEHAEAVLAAYDAENRSTPAAKRLDPVDAASLRNASLVSAALLVFFLVTGPRNAAVAWFERGSADASRILDGEPWRVVTALTLHADGPHVAGNALLGAIFWSAVSRSLGPGLALLSVTAAGATGNWINAWLRTGAHVSVGASTAVFGAVGILGGLGLTRRLHLGERGRRIWIPVAAGLGLLAMLGTGGERVDLWAHAFGLFAGVGFGIGAGPLAQRRPGPLWQWSAGLLAVAVVVSSWLLALGWHSGAS